MKALCFSACLAIALLAVLCQQTNCSSDLGETDRSLFEFDQDKLRDEMKKAEEQGREKAKEIRDKTREDRKKYREEFRKNRKKFEDLNDQEVQEMIDEFERLNSQEDPMTEEEYQEFMDQYGEIIRERFGDEDGDGMEDLRTNPKVQQFLDQVRRDNAELRSDYTESRNFKEFLMNLPEDIKTEMKLDSEEKIDNFLEENPELNLEEGDTLETYLQNDKSAKRAYDRLKKRATPRQQKFFERLEQDEKLMEEFLDRIPEETGDELLEGTDYDSLEEFFKNDPDAFRQSIKDNPKVHQYINSDEYVSRLFSLNENINKNADWETFLQSIADGDANGFWSKTGFDVVLDLLESEYSHLVEVQEIGTTRGDQVVKKVVITDEFASTNGMEKSKAVFTAVHDPSDAIGLSMILTIMARLLHLHEVVRCPIVEYILRTREIHFIPYVNPDGYNLFINGVIRDDFLDLHTNVNFKTCEEGVGVQLNRNYGTDFGSGNAGSGKTKCEENYRGKEAFSESETKFVKHSVADLTSILTSMNYNSEGRNGNSYYVPQVTEAQQGFLHEILGDVTLEPLSTDGQAAAWIHEVTHALTVEASMGSSKSLVGKPQGIAHTLKRHLPAAWQMIAAAGPNLKIKENEQSRYVEKKTAMFNFEVSNIGHAGLYEDLFAHLQIESSTEFTLTEVFLGPERSISSDNIGIINEEELKFFTPVKVHHNGEFKLEELPMRTTRSVVAVFKTKKGHADRAKVDKVSFVIKVENTHPIETSSMDIEMQKHDIQTLLGSVPDRQTDNGKGHGGDGEGEGKGGHGGLVAFMIILCLAGAGLAAFLYRRYKIRKGIRTTYGNFDSNTSDSGLYA